MHLIFVPMAQEAVHQDIFLGFSPEGQQTNSRQWSILIPLCHPEFCRIVSSRGRGRRIVPYHEGEVNILTYFKQARPSTTTNANSLHQYNHHKHCQ